MKKILFLTLGFLLSIAPNAYAVRKGATTSEPKFAAVVGLPSCSGTFIHPRLIITAGHCLPNISGKEVSIAQGSRWKSNNYKIEHMMAHPDFIPNTNNLNDIAYILLQNPITDKNILENIPEINLEKINQLTTGSTILAVGFGVDRVLKAREEEEYLNQMEKKKIDLTIFQEENFMKMSKSAEEGGGVCPGDSGGGTFLEVDNKTYYTGHIVAMQGFCGKKDSTMFTSNIKYYIDWIEKETGLTLHSL
ncbi:MAG: trypsin-like serine protease [Bacteriovorax sp.]|nr:trypsin-like serine protease [Bacteriovorax sp.]